MAKARALAPQNIDSLLLSAYIQRGLGNLPRALTELERVLELTGPAPDVSLNYALWLIEAGRSGEALLEADLVLKESPGDAAALWTRARAQLARGLPAKAVLELSPLTAPARLDFSALAARRLRDTLNSETASK